MSVRHRSHRHNVWRPPWRDYPWHKHHPWWRYDRFRPNPLRIKTCGPIRRGPPLLRTQDGVDLARLVLNAATGRPIKKEWWHG